MTDAEHHAIATWKPRFNPWIIALTVTLATFMEILDTSIANVALRHIAGGFSAGADESTWITMTAGTSGRPRRSVHCQLTGF